MKNKKHNLYTLLSNLSRRYNLGKLVPKNIHNILFSFFSKNKLEKEILNYYESNTIKDNINKYTEIINIIKTNKDGIKSYDFLNIWLKEDKNEKYFDFNGAKLPLLDNDVNFIKSLLLIFPDTFLFSCLLNDNYNKEVVNQFDPVMMEGPYGYIDGNFNVTIRENDIVVDAGAWIGDFSAYAASKKSVVYAFEPVSEVYDKLKKTAFLNDNKIIPIKNALGNSNEEIEIKISKNSSGADSSIYKKIKGNMSEKINVTTLDEFVKKENIKRIDFIKADIEGAERYLLMGAKKVLKEFAPKLAICTYHYPEDPELLKKIILDTNPNYCVKHTRSKLFAKKKD